MVSRTIRKEREDVLDWWRWSLTSAILEDLSSVIQSARRAAREFRNTGCFETMIFLRPGCLDVSAQLAVSNILPLESPPRVSIAPLTVDLRLPSQRQEEGAQLTPASRSPKVSQQPVQGAPRRSEL